MRRRLIVKRIGTSAARRATPPRPVPPPSRAERMVFSVKKVRASSSRRGMGAARRSASEAVSARSMSSRARPSTCSGSYVQVEASESESSTATMRSLTSFMALSVAERSAAQSSGFESSRSAFESAEGSPSAQSRISFAAFSS
jgi:hypothetical protein